MSQLKPPVNNNDHVQGSANTPIELVEFGDYQCSHCGRAHPIIKRIQQQMGDRLKFVFRNFPLAESHPNAVNAALAAEAAALQGKFWQMHDAIYEHQQQLEEEDLMNYAKGIGLDEDQFAADYGSEEVEQKVNDDFESGVRSGVNGTPSFFINGEKYNGNWDEQTLLHHLKAMV